MCPRDEAVLGFRWDYETVEHQHATERTHQEERPVTPSDNLLRRLARVNPTTAFLIALAVMVAGLLLPGIIGAALLFLLGAAMLALTVTTWPVQVPTTRAIRAVLLVLLFAAVVAKAL
ncbi:hypothetical protein ACWKSP_40005 [Micromonosporaceae bacterium Da 78-11]